LIVDASPIVGRELFGMIWATYFYGQMRVSRMPGSTLAHTFATAKDKNLALLLAMWLETGPEIHVFIATVLSCRSLTSDMGGRGIDA